MGLPRATAGPTHWLETVVGVDEENVKAEVRIEEKHRAAMRILLAAHEYAADLRYDIWDLAVEISDLMRVGLFTPDIRWLVHKGFVEHGHERRTLTGEGRDFHRNCGLLLRKKSCFVLTEAGLAFARRLCRTCVPAPPPVDHRPAPCLAVAILSPIWDRARQQLLVGERIVKEFKVPAPNQEHVLAAFEEEGWPVRIDDPLPPVPEQSPKLRLHTTVNALNRNQRNRLIRFSGDGRGEGIRWELLSPGKNGHQFATAVI
ncbi:MAG: hypothetical protein GXY83_12730 [Rhodopirellula sp.]|nr:hypothetical protein [Rhodopirellula sp.]